MLLVYTNEVNDFNLEVRYPVYRREFYKKCTKDWEHRFNFLPKSPAMFLTKASGYTLPFYS
jgi:hypothetical protein